MATIAGVNVGAFALPENDNRTQNVSIGQAADGSVKYAQYRASDKAFQIILHGKTTAVKDSLLAALEADADRIVTIAPDSHVSLGGAGAGVSVTALWIDKAPNAVKDNHDFWTVTLNFIRVS